MSKIIGKYDEVVCISTGKSCGILTVGTHYQIRERRGDLVSLEGVDHTYFFSVDNFKKLEEQL